MNVAEIAGALETAVADYSNSTVEDLIVGLDRLHRAARFTATRVGTPGCLVREEAEDDMRVIDTVRHTLKALRGDYDHLKGQP